jgi:hypothetical protein
MTALLGSKGLEGTKLWKRLGEPFPGNGESDIAKRLAANAVQISEEACARAKRFASLHPEYTLHDETHFLRVTELMGLIIPDEVLATILSPVEITLLILSAYFHDQGMVPDATELTSMETSQEFQLFKTNWAIEHPNYLEISQRAIDNRLSDSERARLRALEGELNGAMLTDYIRRTHGLRSAELVNASYGLDKRLEVSRVNIGGHLARLCLSHTIGVDELVPSLWVSGELPWKG